MERDMRYHASKGDDQSSALKAALRAARDKLRALPASVLLESKIPRQDILDCFRRAPGALDQLLHRGFRSRQKVEAELQSAVLEL
jgi:hypothetical protein